MISDDWSPVFDAIHKAFAETNATFDHIDQNIHNLQKHLDTLSMIRAVDPQGELCAFATMMSLKRGSRR